MTSRVSSSYRGCPQKLCLVLMLLLTLVSHLQVVHGKDGKPAKDEDFFNLFKDKKHDDTKTGKADFFWSDEEVEEEIRENDYDLDFFNPFDTKDDDTKTGKTRKAEMTWSEEVDDDTKTGKTGKTGKAKIMISSEEVEEEIREYDYDLDFPLVDGEFTKNEQNGIMKEFQNTYNSMYTEMVVLDTELVVREAEADPEARSRSLARYASRTTSRYRRISMRARAAGPNARAMRPLFSSNSKRNRLLLDGTAEPTDEAFFEQFEKNIVQYTTAPTLPGGIDATLLGTSDSDEKPEEGFFTFKAKMVLMGGKTKRRKRFKKRLKKAFQIAYNDMYSHENYIPANTTDMYSNENYLTANTSLVVEVTGLRQVVKRRKNNTTDVIYWFKGTLYTNFPMETADVFGDFDFLLNENDGEWKEKKKLKLKPVNGLPN
eukprot:CAMPEP_0198282056 /NCGR_PEP_ID=MMETSP1449-20131203/1913_1 /TAXON_ID=420275 /ORGANISM="Attheya septentrionalis, Strain CCMP2084" /LENGTH=428 /DNA_ID=CAMNT_0043978129 /DNA_START=100 /DNA_END=1386 /DNA_ORIENTATION=-